MGCWALPLLISTLQRAEVQLATRAMLASARTSMEAIDRRALEREVEMYEQIDDVCRAVSLVLTAWVKDKFSTVPLVVPDKFCEPVVYRMRDATRLLMECGRIPQEFDKSKNKIFEELLVNRWHNYAERFFMQRWREGMYSK